MERHRIRTRAVIIWIIVASMLLMVGFIIGTYTTTKAFLDVASRFIDPKLVQEAVWHYTDNIKSNFPEPVINLTR